MMAGAAKVNFGQAESQACCKSPEATPRRGECWEAPAGDLASKIDHTNLAPQASSEDIQKLCEEARRYGFAAVCVNPAHVRLAVRLLKECSIKVCSVAAFPLGATLPAVKAFEARQAIEQGAREIDMVLNIGALKSKDYGLLEEDLRMVRQATRGKILKVILETAILSREEIVRASLYAREAGADFVKTSTGFSSRGATVEDVRIIREAVGPALGIKAAGGISTRRAVEELLAAGATRIGTSSSVKIVTEGG